ncbi:MAG: HRDC domain-containing protein [Bacteroidota bacterium]
MQIKIISIPVRYGEQENEELNRFLRGHRILKVDKQLVESEGTALWTFCIEYIEQSRKAPPVRKERVDYKAVLSASAFERFSLLRKQRKKIAQEEGIPAYAVFTDKELAALAEIETLNISKMQQVEGIGAKKVEKYGARILEKEKDEKS